MDRYTSALAALLRVSACSRSQPGPQAAAPAPGDSAAAQPGAQAPRPADAAGPTATVPARRPRYDRYVVTAEELAEQARGMTNLYDYVITRRNDWIRAAGGGRLRGGASRMVSVYVDGIRFGSSPDAMRQIPVGGVYLARRLGASEAAAKYGLDNNAGTIEIFTSQDRVR
ncbi:MAG: hypothetical protein A2085_02300 [Gemmatimonadetes bacterium GWC2_71_10]|nr:MAG: hypothetical protein A2085_02300 [Gemmatimonadetes bacterium GWC2_71_10]